MNIKIKNIISISEARSRIFEIAEKVQKKGQVFAFTENGKAKVVMIGAEEYDSLLEDIELANDPKFINKMKMSDEEFKRGEFFTWEGVKKDLAKNHEILVLADKPKKGYSNKKK